MVKSFISLVFFTLISLSVCAQEQVKFLSTRERIYFGGGLNGFSIGNPTSIGISPSIGYLATNSTVFGATLTFQYIKFQNASSSLLGTGVFIKQHLPVFNERIGPIYLTSQIDSFNQLGNTSVKYSTPVLLGVGSGNRTGTNYSILYDLNYSTNSNSPYGGAWVVQIGGLYF